MRFEEFLEKVSAPDNFMTRGWSRDEIKALSNSESTKDAKQLQVLFCYAKACLDPSGDVKETQEKMRESGAEESVIMEMSTLMEEHIFEYEWAVHDAIRGYFYNLGHGVRIEQFPSMEVMYSVETA